MLLSAGLATGGGAGFAVAGATFHAAAGLRFGRALAEPACAPPEAGSPMRRFFAGASIVLARSGCGARAVFLAGASDLRLWRAARGGVSAAARAPTLASTGSTRLGRIRGGRAAAAAESPAGVNGAVGLGMKSCSASFESSNARGAALSVCRKAGTVKSEIIRRIWRRIGGRFAVGRKARVGARERKTVFSEKIHRRSGGRRPAGALDLDSERLGRLFHSFVRWIPGFSLSVGLGDVRRVSGIDESAGRKLKPATCRPGFRLCVAPRVRCRDLRKLTGKR